MPVHLNVVADSPESLEAKPEQIAPHRALVQQAYKLFGSHHYDHYDFLFALSDEFGGIGREHHQSSENGVKPGYFTDWAKSEAGPRPAAARIHPLVERQVPPPGRPGRPQLQHAAAERTAVGVRRPDPVLGQRAGRALRPGLAAERARRAGRQRRPLRQHAPAAPGAPCRTPSTTRSSTRRRPLGWTNWQRSEDYYVEGQLIWLDVDTLIREMSGDKRSLDDFARAFFGVERRQPRCPPSTPSRTWSRR